MPKVVVTYFELKGLGECIRMLLAYGGQEFEDRRIPKDDWPALKPKTPFQQLPLLEMDGKVYAQSVPIARLLGRKYGLAGADSEQDFEIDQNVAIISDIIVLMKIIRAEEDPEKKKKKQEEYQKDKYPFYLDKLTELITKNKGYLALGKLTWGDFFLAGVYDSIKMALQIPDLDTRYPVLKKHHDSIRSLPGVKEFVANAPKDAFFH